AVSVASHRSWRRPTPALFPYTTLFRSQARVVVGPAVQFHRQPQAAVETPFQPFALFALRHRARDPQREQAVQADGVEVRALEPRSEEHTSELQSRENLVCGLLLEKKKD